MANFRKQKNNGECQAMLIAKFGSKYKPMTTFNWITMAFRKNDQQDVDNSQTNFTPEQWFNTN
jgi:hypothetical protein